VKAGSTVWPGRLQKAEAGVSRTGEAREVQGQQWAVTEQWLLLPSGTTHVSFSGVAVSSHSLF